MAVFYHFMVSLQAKILWYLFIQVNLILAFHFHAFLEIGRSQLVHYKPLVSINLLFYFSYTGVTGEN